MDDALRFDQVTILASDGRVLLRNAAWVVQKGSRLHLKGETGALQALLKVCAGLQEPDSGTVVLEGVPIGSDPMDHPFLRRGALGWVPEDGGLWVNQTLCANVALPLRFHRSLSRMHAEKEAHRWLEQVGLESRAFLRPHALEPQARWLGALARAAALEPDLWLVDRPPLTLSPAETERATQLLPTALQRPATTVITCGWPLADAAPWRLEALALSPGGPS